MASWFNYGQQVKGALEDKTLEDGFKQSLPPLESLISSALKNSPHAKILDSNYEYSLEKVSLTKRQWLQTISIQADYGYGNLINLSNQQTTAAPISQVLLSSEQATYNVGGMLRLPLADILNRRKRIKMAKLEAKRAEHDQQIGLDGLKLKITELYYQLVNAHNLLSIASDAVEANRVQSLSATAEFGKGMITLAEYTAVQQTLNGSLTSYEERKTFFLITWKSLELASGIKIPIDYGKI